MKAPSKMFLSRNSATELLEVKVTLMSLILEVVPAVAVYLKGFEKVVVGAV
jgi:hypothetical protein